MTPLKKAIDEFLMVGLIIWLFGGLIVAGAIIGFIYPGYMTNALLAGGAATALSWFAIAVWMPCC